MRTAARCISSLAVAARSLPPAPASLSALCPQTKSGEIVVCAEIDRPRSPYLPPIPRLLPEFGTRESESVPRQRNSLFAYDGGGSSLCSTVGPGGMLGCSFRHFKATVEQSADASDRRGWAYQGTGE